MDTCDAQFRRFLVKNRSLDDVKRICAEYQNCKLLDTLETNKHAILGRLHICPPDSPPSFERQGFNGWCLAWLETRYRVSLAQQKARMMDIATLHAECYTYINRIKAVLIKAKLLFKHATMGDVAIASLLHYCNTSTEHEMHQQINNFFDTDLLRPKRIPDPPPHLMNLTVVGISATQEVLFSESDMDHLVRIGETMLTAQKTHNPTRDSNPMWYPNSKTNGVFNLSPLRDHCLIVNKIAMNCLNNPMAVQILDFVQELQGSGTCQMEMIEFALIPNEVNSADGIIHVDWQAPSFSLVYTQAIPLFCQSCARIFDFSEGSQQTFLLCFV